MKNLDYLQRRVLLNAEDAEEYELFLQTYKILINNVIQLEFVLDSFMEHLTKDVKEKRIIDAYKECNNLYLSAIKELLEFKQGVNSHFFNRYLKTKIRR